MSGQASLDELVVDILRDLSGSTRPTIGDELTLHGDLAIDSYALMALAARLEEATAANLTPFLADLNDVRTVADIKAFAHRLSEAHAP